ncbi:hypothetical protein BST81_08110 [Leptolyngbya sp. 'hensonii']|uniref:hypothetical protein n=1 Tax=Leptolyngbya sp. 'hensonii' TaxID=1922337 RepID=UPI00094FED0A|nr:hypothetical protein [Leptolyngbya sp. 'hensonii']OLP18872.1 hypothetical protein BST81_08110 [Leptolyngbya sp. 'hensonii']
MKLANPLHYPLAVLAGGILLVVGVRIVNLPGAVVLPLSAAVATVGALVLKAREPETLGLENPALEREILAAKEQARALAARAHDLRSEASRLLTHSTQMELLSVVQYACDRACELPNKIDELAHKFRGSASLLSATDLQNQLHKAQDRLRKTVDGPAREQLLQLTQSLKHNIQLAQQGQDAREAQVVSLARLIFDSAGVLQSMQNQLRTANLQDTAVVEDLQTLGDELKLFQENVDLLVERT